MKRPAVIVDPLSSGIELAPTFLARGIPAIAVTLETEEWPEFGSKMKASDFLEILPDQPGLAEKLRMYDPIAVLPGTEEAIPLAERLTGILTPHLANDPAKKLHRAHKSYMQRALEEAGVPALKTLHTDSLAEAHAWLLAQGLTNTPLILKPPSSSGSEMVFHVNAGEDWKNAFREILSTPSVLTGKKNESVVVQEQAIGQEYAVGTVSAHGKHYLVHLIKYNKACFGGRKTVYDHVEFVPHDERVAGLWEYVQRSLDAVGVRWGATHTEVMLTAQGPRLIETSARMIGGPVVGFARAATGSSQADKLVDIYAEGDVRVKEFQFKKTVVPVFLKAVKAGVVSNLEVFDRASELATLLLKYVWVKNGQKLPQTVDYLTAIGIIALGGDREAIFRDYERIRAMEAELVIT
jgi:biotin carboxylase